jgi:hypothetical protein
MVLLQKRRVKTRAMLTHSSQYRTLDDGAGEGAR